MNKQVKQLNKVYNKRFKQLNKNLLTVADSGLVIFIEHLKYLRDIYIITQKPAEVIASLNAAIEEFEAHNKTHNEFHWNNFCEFVKLNMREWLIVNDSV